MQKVRSSGIRGKLVPFTAFLLVPLLLGSAQQSQSPDSLSATAKGPYAQAVAAMRHHDCAGAIAALSPLTAAKGPETVFAKLLSGLYAHSCGQVPLAEERLFAAAEHAGLLEDWRLYLLSDDALARGHRLLARAVLAKLLGDYHASPLRARALARAAALSWQQGDAARALEVVRQARREGLHGDERIGLEKLAWEIGTRTGDAAVRGEAARELLIDSPATASQLGVVEVFRQQNGDLPWSGILSADQLRRRAQTLLALDLGPSALATLDAVTPADRDLGWRLLEAEILTRIHRGRDALSLLSSAAAATPRQTAALEWARAQAAVDVAMSQRGGSRRMTAERRRLRLVAQEHLRRVAEIGTDPGLSAKALRTLYSELAQDNLIAPSIAVLRRLHLVDPKDTTGAAYLWSRGWQEYGRRSYSRAVSYWTQLATLYPQDGNARRGRYWTGRACEAMRENGQAERIYADLAAADTNDFYRRNALQRLERRRSGARAARESLPGVPATVTLAGQLPDRPDRPDRVVEPWPTEPLLGRARLLSDVGLDDLALSEVELVKDRAEPRAVAALQALVLARKGDYRKSASAIRDAFPALGGPYQKNVPEEALELYYPLQYQEAIRASALMNGVPVYLVFGIIRQESAFDVNARSWAGARGLMQLMPDTARELARHLGLSWSWERMSEPAFNVQIGTTYLRQVLGMFGGNLELALAGYNGGPFRIKRLWREARTSDLDRFLEGLTLEESKTYVKRILVLSDSYRQLYPHAG
jgi:soluble lytic murein transglycosylase-like protein